MATRSLSQAVFAVVLIGLGILGLIRGDFAPGWQPVPKALPARQALALLCSFGSLACGAGLLWERAAAPAARALFAWLLLWMLLLRLPWLFLSFEVGTWWSTCSTAVLLASAWVLYSWLAADRDRQRFGFVTGDPGIRVARMLFGLALIPFGLAHFLYLESTAPLVPGWLPWHVGWSYFTGGTFIAAGVAVLAGAYARLAAALAALQIGLFTLLIWVPMVMAGRPTAFQRNEAIVSVLLTAAAWVVADSWRGTPWLAVRERWAHSSSSSRRGFESTTDCGVVNRR
jgi:uncharacterized membrane protein